MPSKLYRSAVTITFAPARSPSTIAQTSVYARQSKCVSVYCVWKGVEVGDECVHACLHRYVCGILIMLGAVGGGAYKYVIQNLLLPYRSAATPSWRRTAVSPPPACLQPRVRLVGLFPHLFTMSACESKLCNAACCCRLPSYQYNHTAHNRTRVVHFGMPTPLHIFRVSTIFRNLVTRQLTPFELWQHDCEVLSCYDCICVYINIFSVWAKSKKKRSSRSGQLAKSNDTVPCLRMFRG